MSFIGPGVRLMGGLSFPRKFALVSFLLLVPTIAGMGTALLELDDRIQFSDKERQGILVLRPLRALLDRAAAPAITGSKSAAWHGLIRDAMDEIQRADDRMPESLLGANRNALLTARPSNGPPRPEDIARLFAGIVDTIAEVGDRSNLILDPDLDTYYLMDAAVVRIPEARMILGDAQQFAEAFAQSRETAGERRLRAVQFSARLRANLVAQKRGLSVATRSSRVGLRPDLTHTRFATYERAAERLLALLESPGAASDLSNGDISSAAGASAAAASGWWDGAIEDLDRLLAVRIDGFVWRRTVFIAITGLAMLLATYLFMSMYLSIKRSVTALADAAARMTGDSNVDVVLEARDELAQVSLAFNAIATRMRSEWKLAREGEMRARTAEERVRRIIDAALDGIALVNAVGMVIEWNPQATVILGWSREQALGKPITDLILPGIVRPTSPPTLNGGLGLLLGDAGQVDGGGKRTEMLVARCDGREISVELSVVRIEIATGSAFGVFLRDLSEKNNLEVQLRQAQKLESIGQLAAGIAHEINTPIQFVGDNLHFVKGAFEDMRALLAEFRELLEQTAAGGDGAVAIERARAAEEERDLAYLNDNIPRSVDMALEGAARVAAIVRAMKEFSHPGTAEKTAVDINRAIVTTLTVAHSEYKYVADACLDLDRDLPSVTCLPGEINQVLLNLIVNAAHAIGDVVRDHPGDKGTITLLTRRVGAFAEIRVTDTGGGIPEHVRARLFDPFFTTKAVGKGTGQGLTIARNVVVTKHGGELTFESEVGKGTSFIVRLPLEPAAA